MSSFQTDNEETLASINVIPLVDIILVVLIIFMVTAPMFLKPSIGVNLPKAASGDSTKPSQLSISLGLNGKLMLNGLPSDLQSIKQKASDEFSKNAEVQAIIAADKDVPHGEVISILDAIKELGIKKFAISIDKK